MPHILKAKAPRNKGKEDHLAVGLFCPPAKESVQQLPQLRPMAGPVVSQVRVLGGRRFERGVFRRIVHEGHLKYNQ